MAMNFEGSEIGKLIFEHGGEKLTLTDAGFTKIGKGGSPITLKNREAAEALEAVLEEVSSNASGLSEKAKAALKSTIGDFGKFEVNADKLKPVKGAFEAAGNIAANHADPKVVGANLLKHPMAEQLLAADDMSKLRASGFSFQRLDSYKQARDALKGLVESAKPDVAGIKKILIDNHENIDHLKLSEEQLNAIYKKTGINVNLGEIKGEINTAVTKASGEAKGFATKVIDLSKKIELEGKKTKPDAKVIEALKGDLTKATEGFKTATSGEFGNAVTNSLDAKLKESLGKASSELNSHMGTVAKAADVAGKTQWGWTKKIGPKAEGITGALWKNRGVGGKAGVLALGAGAAYGVYNMVFAGAGDKVPSERLEPSTRNMSAGFSR
jgi:hypothetical protein